MYTAKYAERSAIINAETGTSCNYFKLTKGAHNYVTCMLKCLRGLVLAKEFEFPNLKGVAMARKSCKTYIVPSQPIFS